MSFERNKGALVKSISFSSSESATSSFFANDMSGSQFEDSTDDFYEFQLDQKIEVLNQKIMDESSFTNFGQAKKLQSINLNAQFLIDQPNVSVIHVLKQEPNSGLQTNDKRGYQVDSRSRIVQNNSVIATGTKAEQIESDIYVLSKQANDKFIFKNKQDNDHVRLSKCLYSFGFSNFEDMPLDLDIFSKPKKQKQSKTVTKKIKTGSSIKSEASSTQMQDQDQYQNEVNNIIKSKSTRAKENQGSKYKLDKRGGKDNGQTSDITNQKERTRTVSGLVQKKSGTSSINSPAKSSKPNHQSGKMGSGELTRQISSFKTDFLNLQQQQGKNQHKQQSSTVKPQLAKQNTATTFFSDVQSKSINLDLDSFYSDQNSNPQLQRNPSDQQASSKFQKLFSNNQSPNSKKQEQQKQQHQMKDSQQGLRTSQFRDLSIGDISTKGQEQQYQQQIENLKQQLAELHMSEPNSSSRLETDKSQLLYSKQQQNEQHLNELLLEGANPQQSVSKQKPVSNQKSGGESIDGQENNAKEANTSNVAVRQRSYKPQQKKGGQKLEQQPSGETQKSEKNYLASYQMSKRQQENTKLAKEQEQPKVVKGKNSLTNFWQNKNANPNKSAVIKGNKSQQSSEQQNPQKSEVAPKNKADSARKQASLKTVESKGTRQSKNQLLSQQLKQLDQETQQLRRSATYIKGDNKLSTDNENQNIDNKKLSFFKQSSDKVQNNSKVFFGDNFEKQNMRKSFMQRKDSQDSKKIQNDKWNKDVKIANQKKPNKIQGNKGQDKKPGGGEQKQEKQLEHTTSKLSKMPQRLSPNYQHELEATLNKQHSKSKIPVVDVKQLSKSQVLTNIEKNQYTSGQKVAKNSDKEKELQGDPEASFQNRKISQKQNLHDTQRESETGDSYKGSEISVSAQLRPSTQTPQPHKCLSAPSENENLLMANALILNEPQDPKNKQQQNTLGLSRQNTSPAQQSNEEGFRLSFQKQLPRLNIQAVNQEKQFDDFNFNVNLDSSQRNSSQTLVDQYGRQGLFSKKTQSLSPQPGSQSSNQLLQSTQSKVVLQSNSSSGPIPKQTQNQSGVSSSLLGVVSPHQYTRFKGNEGDIDQQVQEYSQQSKAMLNRESKVSCQSFQNQVVCVKSVIGGRESMEDEFSVQPNTIKMRQLSPSLALLEQVPDTIKKYYGSQVSSQENYTQIDQKEDDFQFYAVYDGHGGSSAANFCKDRLCSNFKARMHVNFKRVISATIDEQHTEKVPVQALSQERNQLKTASSKSQYSASVLNNNNMSDLFGNLDPKQQQVVDRISALTAQGNNIQCTDSITFSQAIQNSLEESFVQTDMDFDEYNDDGNIVVGTTALAAVVSQTQIYAAHCGDSRAILYRNGQSLPLTSDHKADRQDEQMRVLKNGGQILFWGSHRLQGVLAMTRSIGDKYLRPYITCVPEVTVLERQKGDEFIVLASDGLWDVLSNLDVGQMVKDVLHKYKQVDQEKQVSKACQLLVDKALAKGSRDNITVIVIKLQNNSSE